MFNHGKFNLTRFNLSAGVKEVWFKRDCAENIDGVAGGKTYKEFARAANENMRSLSNIVVLLPLNRNSVSQIQSKLVLRKLIPVIRDSQEGLYCTSVGSKNMSIIRSESEDLSGLLVSGKIIHYSRTLQEAVKNLAYAGKFYLINRATSEILRCETSAGLTEYLTFTVDIQIPAGGEIRINSDVFTATSGLSNIIADFEGDWIFLTRETVQLNVDSGSGGNITGEVVYNERYL